jgi:hypothetical protein
MLLLYFRCVFNNRATLLGYTALVWIIIRASTGYGEFLLPIVNVDSTSLAVFLMIVGILGTRFGFETMEAYKRVTQAIKDQGRPDPRLIKEYRMYCGWVGAKMALEDAYDQCGLRIT